MLASIQIAEHKARAEVTFRLTKVFEELPSLQTQSLPWNEAERAGIRIF